MTDIAGLSGVARAAGRDASVRPTSETLRRLVIAAGIGASVLFVAVGLGWQLQLYADGSLFSYAVAVRDAWAFHCHNISGRLSVYLLAFAPAEAYVQLTGDPHGGVVLYGAIFFAAQGLGLLLTWTLDRSPGRILFGYACMSTACLCPLVFGFPTEVWAMHALFWPTLAACHYARRGVAGAALILALMPALAFTHSGAMISLVAILATLALRGWRDAALRRAGGIFLLVVTAWVIVKSTLRPDDYMAAVMMRAALHVFDISILTGDFMMLLLCALAGYAIACYALRHLEGRAHLYAGALVAGALALYWLRFDHALHAENRYYLRTVLLLATPAFGFFAAAQALSSEGSVALPWLPRVMDALTGDVMARAAIGAVLLVMLIHCVETVKFLHAWTGYKTAVRSLATGAASDAALGDARFVSSKRIGADLNRLSWFSTTPFLSVLLAPNFKPGRLVVHPTVNYFWLSCETATESLQARRTLPAESRELVRVYSCLHRRRRVPSAHS